MHSQRLTFATVRAVSTLRKTYSRILTATKDLQAIGLIPRSPSPIPLEDRAEETLTREELLEVFRKQKVHLYPWQHRNLC